MNPYRSFRDLADNEVEGRDYAIIHRRTDSAIAILAPHGGGIEPGTIAVADAIAAAKHNFYAFSGIKPSGNWTLHITSASFDEPLALLIAERSQLAVTIHGCANLAPMIFLGGRHRRLKEMLLRSLIATDFPAQLADTEGLRGMQPTNLCNRCRTGEGVQIELSRGLRRQLFALPDDWSSRTTTTYFDHLVQTIRATLSC